MPDRQRTVGLGGLAIHLGIALGSTLAWAQDPGPEIAQAGLQDPVVVEVDREAWLRALVEAEDWVGLRTESLRWAFEASDPDVQARARFYEGWALLQAGDRHAAVLRLTALEEQAPAEWQPMAALAAAYAWRELDPGIAEARYARLQGPAAVREQAVLGLVWSLARQAKFAQAREVLPPYAPVELAHALERPRWRRGGVAAALSAVVPGSGQLYAGAPREALAAFVVVGGLGAGTVALATQGKRGSAIALGVVAGTFWLGNIYGGADAAARANRRRRRQAMGQVEALETPVWPGIVDLSAPAPR